MKRALLFFVTHAAALAVGFAAGIYTLPILIAPPAPSASEVSELAGAADYKGEFRRNLKGSDPLHWGEGQVSLNPKAISLAGRVAPGPDYKLYLTTEFVETKQDFERVRAASLRVGDVKTFDNFIVPLDGSVDLAKYNSVVVWCETFSQFITAARYR
jgi:hypothetical protein